jgi:hypothetical protein
MIDKCLKDGVVDIKRQGDMVIYYFSEAAGLRFSS